MKSKIIISVLIVASFIFSACDKFLDQMPDNRVEKLSIKQIQRLLVNAYTTGNYAVMCELSGDNFVDNQSPDKEGNYYNLGAREIWHDEAFAWKDIVSAGDNQDSPTYVWDGCYYAIAVANNALEQIEKLEQVGTPRAETAAVEGEALLCRAYHHFLLVNIFSQAYRTDNLSKNDLGIPYITKPETKVFVDYERGNVTDVYNQIEKDLLEGLSLVDDGYYSVPKYHFNIKAAHAFAARFYLYKRDYSKVIEHANIVLGADALLMMRNWGAETPTAEACGLWWVNATSSNNLMLVSTASWALRIFGTRYSCNRDAEKATIGGVGPTWDEWSFHPCYDSRMYYSGKREYGLYFMGSAYEFFEYSDKIAGIGYGHIIRPEFTAEETLLCRAEAYFFQNRIAEAIADLKIIDDSRKIIKDAKTGAKIPERLLTEDLMKNFYTKASNSLYRTTTNTEQMVPGWTINSDKKYVFDCILHFRRHETIFNGLRWFDIKRYGIEITHKIGKSTVDVLKWDDHRRALQIPPEAVASGLEPNDRIQLGQNNAYVNVYRAADAYLIVDKDVQIENKIINK